MNSTLHALALALLACVSAGAQAHGGEEHARPRPFDAAKAQKTDFGQEGDPKKVVRTIQVDMADSMRFTPADVSVKQGETVRFVIRNKGQVLHEMVLGTKASLAEHAELMKKHPGMEHDEPSMAHVQPGKRGEIVWHFTKAGVFQFACLLPGHYEAGMLGQLTVQ